MLMNNVCVLYIGDGLYEESTKVSTSSEFICASYDHIYVSIIIYCLRAFVVVYKHVILL